MEPVNFQIPRVQNQGCVHFPDMACEECQEKMWQKKLRERQTEELKAQFSEMLARGLVNEATRTARWSTSKPEIESLNPQAWKQARELKGNAYVWGSVGTGKSHMCRCVLRDAFIDGKSIADVSMLAYLTRAKYDSKFCDRVKQVRYLLLDDVDKASFVEPQAVPQFWELMNERATHKRITLMTANVNVKALITLMSTNAPGNSSIAVAAMDRLKPCTQIELTGRSQR